MKCGKCGHEFVAGSIVYYECPTCGWVDRNEWVKSALPRFDPDKPEYNIPVTASMPKDCFCVDHDGPHIVQYREYLWRCVLEQVKIGESGRIANGNQFGIEFAFAEYVMTTVREEMAYLNWLRNNHADIYAEAFRAAEELLEKRRAAHIGGLEAKK